MSEREMDAIYGDCTEEMLLLLRKMGAENVEYSVMDHADDVLEFDACGYHVAISGIHYNDSTAGLVFSLYRKRIVDKALATQEKE